jgi:hypothetical protein
MWFFVRRLFCCNCNRSSFTDESKNKQRQKQKQNAGVLRCAQNDRWKKVDESSNLKTATAKLQLQLRVPAAVCSYNCN